MFFAISSILIGSIGMYNQSSLKRIFAYSSINHVGLMLIGLLTGVDYYGNISIIFHLFLYSITLIGFFSIFINLIPFRILDSKDNENVYLSDYKGLYSRNPYLSSSFIILLFSIAGIPPFSGFFSKFILLLSALQYQLYFVTFIAILGTVISCYKYIQIIKIIIFDDLSQTSFFNFNLLSSFILVISLLISSTIIYPSFFKLYYTIISYLFL
jgi:NADH-quinone oxidoreductase subunit N